MKYMATLFRLKRRSGSDERGLTMMELLVAMALSSLLVVIMFRIFSDQSKSFLENRQAAELQQEMRWAINYLSDRIKLAGNGVPPTSYFTVVENFDGGPDYTDSLAILGCYKNLIVTTDQPMGNEGSQVKVDNTVGMAEGDLAIISDGTFTEVFMITGINSSHLWHDTFLPWNDDKKLDHRYLEGSSLTIATHYSFFVCDDEDGRLSLLVQTQNYPPQPLISDVDDFQIRFKMKDDSWQDEVTKEEIYDIRMVEILLRARTPREITGYVDPTYGDGYKRLEMKTIVVPKNITIM